MSQVQCMHMNTIVWYWQCIYIGLQHIVVKFNYSRDDFQVRKLHGWMCTGSGIVKIHKNYLLIHMQSTLYCVVGRTETVKVHSWHLNRQLKILCIYCMMKLYLFQYTLCACSSYINMEFLYAKLYMHCNWNLKL